MILTALCDYYDAQLARGDGSVPPFGYSEEAISYILILGMDGKLVDIQENLDLSGKKPVAKRMSVPAALKRSGTLPQPNFLWDKTGYVLGVTKPNDDSPVTIKLTPASFEAFRRLHVETLSGVSDPGLRALQAFLNDFRPERFNQPPFRPEMLDRNLAFRIDGESRYLHEHPVLRECWAAMNADRAAPSGMCLVTGKEGPLASIHPSIKGVDKAEESGASIVTFHQPAFRSYGKEKGENSPISLAAAFKYTTALNQLLRNTPRNRQRLVIGGTTIVFWAQAAAPGEADAAVSLMAAFLDPPADDAQESLRLRSALQAVGQGRPLFDLDPQLAEGTRIFVLGLAPSDARLSIRFWITDTLTLFARRLAEHFQDLELGPSPWRTPPGVKSLALVTAPFLRGKFRGPNPSATRSRPEPAPAPRKRGEFQLKDVPPALAGDLLRAILTGGRYPTPLLSNLLMRMRSDHEIDGIRVALCKAVLARDYRLRLGHELKEIPVSLDLDNSDPAYLLGRLFATLEEIQQRALGTELSSTIRDRYFGSAGANPASVFPVLIRNAQNHLAKLRKAMPGAAINLEKQLGSIFETLPVSLPKQQTLEAQGRFAIGFYHQNQARYTPHRNDGEHTDSDGEVQ